MEFAAVNSPKSAAKTVAITLTNEEARNPANAFAALLNLGGNMRFSAGEGLNHVENQWMRASSARDTDAAPKPKDDLDAKPKDDITVVDSTSDDESDDVAATPHADKADDTSTTDTKAVAATSETQPTEQATAIGLEAIQSVAIQFQILVQLPSGGVQDMGTFDLKSLLAAASQDAGLASALEAAFGQAASALANGQSLLGDPSKSLGLDPQLAAALQQAGVSTTEGGGNDAMSDLFKQIAAAFRPLAQQQATTTTPAVVAQQAQAAAAAAADPAKAAIDLQAPETARQAAELSKIFGEDNKMRIQVAVDGRKVADMPFEWSPFNKFAGYNPEAMRTMSTANGQAGLGQVTNALIGGDAVPQPSGAPTTTPPATPAAAQPATLGAVLPQGAAAVKTDVAAVRAPEQAAQTNSTTTNNTSSNTPSSSFATALSQAAGTNTAAAQTSSAERPAPTQAQQVIDQIKVNITRAAKAGLDKVTIALRPEELGRIEIKLEMTQDGQVRANVTADNPATLELLQREARGLERALQDAGLNTDASDLEFNLRSEDQDRLAEQRDSRGQGGRNHSAGGDPTLAANENEEVFDYQRAANLRGGVDTYA
jgi:flagellar hook-length control protein FliK